LHISKASCFSDSKYSFKVQIYFERPGMPLTYNKVAKSTKLWRYLTFSSPLDSKCLSLKLCNYVKLLRRLFVETFRTRFQNSPSKTDASNFDKLGFHVRTLYQLHHHASFLYTLQH
jgi:hypothetical protein